MGSILGSLINRVTNYFYPNNEIIYSRELCITFPVTQNDIYKEQNIIDHEIKHKIHNNKKPNSYKENEIIEI